MDLPRVRQTMGQSRIRVGCSVRSMADDWWAFRLDEWCHRHLRERRRLHDIYVRFGFVCRHIDRVLIGDDWKHVRDMDRAARRSRARRRREGTSPSIADGPDDSDLDLTAEDLRAMWERGTPTRVIVSHLVRWPVR